LEPESGPIFFPFPSPSRGPFRFRSSRLKIHFASSLWFPTCLNVDPLKSVLNPFLYFVRQRRLLAACILPPFLSRQWRLTDAPLPFEFSLYSLSSLLRCFVYRSCPLRKVFHPYSVLLPLLFRLPRHKAAVSCFHRESSFFLN